ncbi:hypothetical protein [Luteimonas yindakuii]|uniref:hypothetical protein n=1 Tax=Luteimonas yindakuii TaxID=2565782 RepID=UPI00141ECF33|nr:hypothetical protein [Luteimonas yindakuii]
MNQITSAVLFVAIPSCLHACAGAMATEVPAPSCRDFIGELEATERPALLEYDIEHLLSLKPENYTDAYGAIQPLMSGCIPGDIDSARPEDIKAPWGGRPYVDVAAGVMDDIPWIQFVYPAIGEAGPGLASSIVFYGQDAKPRSTHLVSAYYAWENATTLRSTLSSGTIQGCTQHIEHFSYNKNGDMAEALDRPIRSGCESSSSRYPTDDTR